MPDTSTKTKKAIVWVNCPDCGDETIEGSLGHELTCRVKNGTAHTTPIVDGELIGSCDMPTPEPGEGLEVEFSCHLCGAIVKQDASEDMSIDEAGNPLCSNICKGVSRLYKRKAAKAETDAERAIREYVELDLEEQAHRAFYKARSAAASRIVELVGVGGHFQDAAGTVYEVTPVTGKFVHFTPYEAARTRRGEEVRGSLSLERAEELGYEVLHKRKAAKKRKPPLSLILPDKPGKPQGDEIPF